MMRAYKRLILVLIAVLMLTCCSSAVFAASGEKISLSAWDRTESLAFQMTNMVPGDSETKEYAITVNDKRAVSLHFAMDLRASDEMLASVLHIKVEQADNVLYDGTFAEMPALTIELSGKMPQTVNFRMTVSLDTSVGNEYMGKTLSADFNWSIERKSDTPIPPLETTTVKPTPIETTIETTTAETTTVETTTETVPSETTSQSEESTTMETSTNETTTQAPVETTSVYEETTTVWNPPSTEEPCCECCVGYGFPYSCNFGSLGADDIGCDLPWCCAGGNGCHCPWCWIVPLVILIALAIVSVIILRKLTKKEEEENADEQTKE